MIRPWHTSLASQRGLTGAAAAFVVLLALCQSPVRNLGRGQVQGPCCPTGSPTTPPSLPSCGWLRPTPSSSCASVRRAAATTGSLAVECRPTRPVRADPPPKTIRTTTAAGTTTITPAAKGPINQGCVGDSPADTGCREQRGSMPSFLALRESGAITCRHIAIRQASGFTIEARALPGSGLCPSPIVRRRRPGP